MQRADWARSFVEHPYWGLMARMLNNTIQAETEEMLRGDDRLPMNRASVAMCRKVLQMPFFDIEQGFIAESRYNIAVQKFKAHSSAERELNG